MRFLFSFESRVCVTKRISIVASSLLEAAKKIDTLLGEDSSNSYYLIEINEIS